MCYSIPGLHGLCFSQIVSDVVTATNKLNAAILHVVKNVCPTAADYRGAIG
jgi:hypothetical protein